VSLLRGSLITVSGCGPEAKLIFCEILSPVIRLRLWNQGFLVGEGVVEVKEGRYVLLKSTGLFEVISAGLSVDSATSTAILSELSRISLWAVSSWKEATYSSVPPHIAVLSARNPAPGMIAAASPSSIEIACR